MKLAIAYASTMVFFLVVDLIWLGWVARDFYRDGMSHLMGDGFNIPAAIAFYFIYMLGVMYFAVNPAVASGDWHKALVAGAAFGFFAYATYDLTNLATLRDWPLNVALVDIVWGTALTGAAAAVGTAIAIKFA